MLTKPNLCAAHVDYPGIIEKTIGRFISKMSKGIALNPFCSESMPYAYCVTFFVLRKNIFLGCQAWLICEPTYFSQFSETTKKKLPR